MPRKKRSTSPFELFNDDFDEDTSSQGSKCGNPPIQRNAANARERARMRVLSSAFGRLKTKLPNIPPDTKLSKLDTLRLATMYIKQLKTLAEGGNCSEGENFGFGAEPSGLFGLHHGSQNMTWPFGLHHIQNSSRQLSFQYTAMDWNHPQEACPRTPHLNNDQYAPQKNSSSHLWLMEESTCGANGSGSCLFGDSTLHNQGQRMQHTHYQQQQTNYGPIR